MKRAEASVFERFEIQEDIAHGAYSVIRKAIEKQTKKEYAAKLVYLKKLSSRDYNRLEVEVEICRKLVHPNIVQLHASGKESGLYYLIFDLILGCDLFDAILTNEYYNEPDASFILNQILTGVSYYQSLNIIHRDLKPENLRLTSMQRDAVVKIIDFGLAIQVSNDAFQHYGIIGTLGYIAPEILKHQKYGKPVDMWSCGVILYILLCGYPPFWEEQKEQLMTKIRDGNFVFKLPEWNDISEEAKSLVTSMLTVDPTKRISVKQALCHKWFEAKDRKKKAANAVVTYARLRKLSINDKWKSLIIISYFVGCLKGRDDATTVKAADSLD